MTVTVMKPSGAVCVTDIVRGYIEQEVYYGYTKEEAEADFREKYKI